MNWTIDGTHYRCELVICGNAECIFDRIPDPSGNGWRDEADEAVTAACEVFRNVLGEDPEIDKEYRNWFGGRYGSQSPMFGYRPVGAGAVARVYKYIGEVDEDGEPVNGWPHLAWDLMDWSCVPASIRDEIERAGSEAESKLEMVKAKTLAP